VWACSRNIHVPVRKVVEKALEMAGVKESAEAALARLHER